MSTWVTQKIMFMGLGNKDSQKMRNKKILFKGKGAQTWSRDYEVRLSKALHQNETDSQQDISSTP